MFMHNNYRRFGLLSSSVVLLFLTTRCTAHSGATESTTEDNALRQALSELSRRRLTFWTAGMIPASRPARILSIEELREACVSKKKACPTCICKKSKQPRNECWWLHKCHPNCTPCAICKEALCCPKCWERFDFTKTEGYNCLRTTLCKDLEALNVGDRIMVDGTDYKTGAEGVWLPAIYKGVDAKKNMIRVTFDASPTKTHRAPLDIHNVRLPGHQSVIQTSFNEQKRQFTKHHVCRE